MCIYIKNDRNVDIRKLRWYIDKYYMRFWGVVLVSQKRNSEAECCEEYEIHTAEVCKAREAMPDETTTSAVSDFFKAFSDKTRLRILIALAVGELCVCDIASLLGMSQSAISHQLRFLKQARLVTNRKSGKTVYYALCDDHIQTILAQGIAHIQEG